MKKCSIVWSVVIAVSIAACVPSEPDDNRPEINLTDKVFIETAAIGMGTQALFGQLANTKPSAHVKVRALGDEMLSEHTNASNALRLIADKYINVRWPAGLDESHQIYYDQLELLGGHDFDSAFLKLSIQDYVTVISLYQNEITGGETEELKQYAEAYVDNLQGLRIKAEALQLELD